VATNEILVPASPEVVFDVLATAERYSEWVVGPRVSGRPEANWPAVGSKFRHVEGRRPFRFEDETEVVEIDAPSRLVLHARMRPIAEARIELTLRSVSQGTRIQMVERLIGGPAARIPPWLTDPLVHLRNRRALARLRRLATAAG
jgi:uncharacterized protein YndB with AHSA1/START domain